jgi:hypothetical protein
MLRFDSRTTCKKYGNHQTWHPAEQHAKFITPLSFALIFNSRSHSVPFERLLPPSPPISGGRKEVTKSIALLWAWSKHHVDYLSQTASTRRPTPVFLSSDTTPLTIEAVMSEFVDTQACSLTEKSLLNWNLEQVGHSLSFSQHIVLRATSRQEILVSLNLRLFLVPSQHLRCATSVEPNFIRDRAHRNLKNNSPRCGRFTYSMHWNLAKLKRNAVPMLSNMTFGSLTAENINLDMLQV